MNDDADFIREYVRVRLSLKETRKAAMKALGYTEDGLKDLERRALEMMQDAETIELENAIVQKVGKPAWIHKDTEYAGFSTYHIHIKQKEQGVTP